MKLDINLINNIIDLIGGRKFGLFGTAFAMCAYFIIEGIATGWNATICFVGLILVPFGYAEYNYRQKKLGNGIDPRRVPKPGKVVTEADVEKALAKYKAAQAAFKENTDANGNTPSGPGPSGS